MVRMKTDRKKGVIEEIADDLRTRVRSGEFGSNGRLPTVVSLSRQWSIARSTIYEAYHVLVLEGVVIQRGNGYFPFHQRQRLNGITPTFDGFLRERGMTPKMENLIEPEIIEMPEDVAAIFGQQPGVHVVHRLRLQGTVEMPLRLAEIWYPADLAGQFLEKMQEKPSLDVLSEIKRVTGLFIKSVHEECIARIPSKEESELLMIPRTAPVIELRRSNFTEDGRPVMFNRIVLIGTMFTLAYDYETTNWS